MIAASFKYRERNGSVVGKVERIEPGRDGRSKDFLVYRLQDGAFKAGLNGKALPLYRADELSQAITDKQTIFIVEGEERPKRSARHYGEPDRALPSQRFRAAPMRRSVMSTSILSQALRGSSCSPILTHQAARPR